MANNETLNISHHNPPKAVGMVNYTSQGRVLVIADNADALSLVDDINLDQLNLKEHRLLSDVSSSSNVHIIGHLGNFRVFEHEDAEEPLAQFDIIVDANAQPLFDYEVPPFGYYHIKEEAQAVKAIEEIPHLTGEFDKPRYFVYEAKRCAHRRRAIEGCSNCIDACSAGAAIEFGDGIKINPWLCQGCGSCAVACPSGAIQYNWPSLEETANELKRQVDSGKSGIAIITEATTINGEIDSGWAVVEMHEVNAIGPELLMYLVARGLRSIIIEKPKHHKTHQAIINNNQWLESITQSALSSSVASLIELKEAQEVEAALQAAPAAMEQSLFDSANDEAYFVETPGSESVKRTLLRASITALLSNQNIEQVALADGAPFGDITIDKEACTLCMSCVNVCPSLALKDGGEDPAINFNQSLCLQCGLCDKSCPEDAISLTPAFNVLAQNENQYTTLNETAKFHCIICDAPFATEKMIETITSKVKGNNHFGGEAEINRLKMCGDCRVVDLLQQESTKGSQEDDANERGRLV